jgi:hypothetical protein
MDVVRESRNATKGLTLTPEIDYDQTQTAMGLPPVTSAVFFIAN